MLLKDALKEYQFDCKARKLSVKTIEGYVRMMGYLLDFLQEEHGVDEVEEARPSPSNDSFADEREGAKSAIYL